MRLALSHALKEEVTPAVDRILARAFFVSSEGERQRSADVIELRRRVRS